LLFTHRVDRNRNTFSVRNKLLMKEEEVRSMPKQPTGDKDQRTLCVLRLPQAKVWTKDATILHFFENISIAIKILRFETRTIKQLALCDTHNSVLGKVCCTDSNSIYTKPTAMSN
jgi:hypothetical protein